MFSGLTNQFTSLVGAVKGSQADEDVPAPPHEVTTTASAGGGADASGAAGEHHDASGEPVDGEEGAKRSKSLVDSFVTEASGWLGSAKGWLGSASIPSMPTMAMPSMPAMPTMPSIPSIPGLRKGGADAEGGDGAAADGQGADITGAVSGDDEDKSRYISATEGADSHPASAGGTPTGEEGQIGQVTTKVTQQAKHFGSFLSSAINKAGAKIKETVKDNTILDSFNKEQDAFIKSQGGSDSGIAPWIGHNNEAKIKEEILGLAQDRRNFVRAPPAGVDFEFNYDTAYPTAIAIMAEDKALETMRFELVPKIITEENFWRNYFYRVSLIIQAAELGTLGADGVGQASSEDASSKNFTETNSNKKACETPIVTAPLLAGSVATGQQKNPNHSNTKHASNNNSNKNSNAQNKQLAKNSKSQKQQAVQQKTSVPAESEFVSDAFQTTTESTDLAEIKDGMRRLGIDSMTQQALDESNEEQWEKDLEAELKDYEVVCGGSGDAGGGGGGGAGGGGGRKKGSTKSARGSGIGTVAGNKQMNLNDDNNDDDDVDADDDENPTISNLRTRSTNNDWEEYADLIEDTDDLK